MPEPTSGTRVSRQAVVIFLVSLAGLLLEVAYTRVVSYKLWYYYVYLVLGLALLGIGSGGVMVAVSSRIKNAATSTILSVCGLAGAVTTVVGYLVVAKLEIDTVQIWDYGTRASISNLARLGLISFVLFASFLPLGVTIAVILGRARDVGRLYFADLVGAGLGCVAAIPLITTFDPPTVIMMAAAVFAVSGVIAADRPSAPVPVVSAVAAVGLVVLVVANGTIPRITPESSKVADVGEYSEWGPVFRVDVVQAFDEEGNIVEDGKLLAHNGTFGAGIRRFDGDAAALTEYDDDPRALPFEMLGEPSDHTLIIGSAGGNEILASLHFGTETIDAVELNPVTVGLLTDEYAEWTGNLDDRPDVTIHNDDGRSFLARSDDSYDLVWYVAPDSYAASNAASSGAFVLSESYLYTQEMIVETLEHLDDDGIMVVQFGELDYDLRPNRTARYAATARAALESMGIENPQDHLALAAYESGGSGDLATIIVKRTPITPDEVDRLGAALPRIDDTRITYTPFTEPAGVAGGIAAATSAAEAEELIEAYDREVSAISDNSPFFWHFNSFRTVLGDITDPIDALDPEDSIGERVLLLLLAIAVIYAAVFLLLPFVKVRDRWASLPMKGRSGIYFSALGLAFMLLEISLIQNLTLLLGYPTYSLTVTLATILVTTGIGALLSERVAGTGPRVIYAVFAVLAALVVFYQLALGPITDALIGYSLGVRIAATVALLTPLGFCLGMFMPIGLHRVSALSGGSSDYVAWAWAVNGFFSVIGSVLTTILSMSLGFDTVMYVALGIYGVAVLAFTALSRTPDPVVDLSAPPIRDASGASDPSDPHGDLQPAT